MSQHNKRIPYFIGLLVLSILIFVISLTGWLNGFTGVIQRAFLPFLRTSFVLFHKEDNSQLARLKNENADLRIQLVKLTALEKDNGALRDQFAISNPDPKKLLPASVILLPSFIPGVSLVDEILIDKGSRDGVKAGSSVVYKENLIGKVVKASSDISVVDLLNHKGISFTAQTAKTSANGIMRGTGEDRAVFDNVSLSDVLKKDDAIIIKDPEQLIVGKIVSVNKKASSLFQSAEVESLVDVEKLQMVFVIIGDR